MAERPGDADVFGPGCEFVVGFRVFRQHHDIRVDRHFDRCELQVAHLVGEPGQLLAVESSREVLEAGLATMQRPKVDHKCWNLGHGWTIPGPRAVRHFVGGATVLYQDRESQAEGAIAEGDALWLTLP